MSPEQARAARSWLGWTQAELAERARVGLSTVKDYEGTKRVPILHNLEAIQRALENAGMKFGPDSISGPVKRPR
jgi:transcriptional regulator with XRE-family HTH domain